MDHLFTVDSLSELRDVMPGSARSAFVLGHTRPGDGGGGMFHWNASSRTPDDNGLVVAPPEKQTGRWTRVDSGSLDIRWFGANPTEDATKAIQGALSAAHRGGEVSIPAGTFGISQPLRIPQGVHLSGTGLLSVLNYSGPANTGCLRVDGVPRSISLAISRLNILVQTEGAYGVDLSGMSYSRFDHITVHLRQPNTSGFFGPGNTQSPYYNVFTGCHVAGTADYRTNGCVGFDFTYDRGEQMQSANANQVYGGHLSTCQIAVRCLGVGNVFHGQVIESGDIGYQFDLCPARKTMAQRGIVNDVVGCYTEHVRIPIEQKHADAFVTAQLTYVTGYERVFQAESTRNCVVLSSHYGQLPQSRSVFDRRIDVVTAPPEKSQGNQ